MRLDSFRASPRNSLIYSKGDNYLVRASWKAFPGLFLSPVVPRFLLLLASFAQPLLVSRMITFISNPGQSSERGWALVGGFVCTYALIFLMTSTYWEKVSSVYMLKDLTLTRN